MGGLVVFLHGYTGNRYSWGAVPDKVRASLESFEVAILEYSAAAFSPSTIQTNADRVMTELLTRYPKCEPIYFVGHSLGGLVARELCRKLLAREVENDTLLDKIPAVITFGTPLEGPRFRRTMCASRRCRGGRRIRRSNRC